MQQLFATHGALNRHPPAQAQAGMAMSGLEAHIAAQAPAQHVSVGPQVAPPHLHKPPTHVDPSPQRLPHAPQLLMSESRLLQPAVPQQLCPIPQAAPVGRQPHCPFAHTVPLAHCVPHAPQLRGSAWVPTHSEPQHVPAHSDGVSGQMRRPTMSGVSADELPLAQPAPKEATPVTKSAASASAKKRPSISTSGPP
jgi:hypothetical protein